MKRLLLALPIALLVSSPARSDAGTIQLEKSAELYARSHLVEIATGLKLDHEQDSQLAGSPVRERIRVESEGRLSGIRVVSSQFEPEFKWAVARAEIRLIDLFGAPDPDGSLLAALGEYANRRVVSYGYASDDPQARAIIQAIRVATLDACASILAEIRGQDHRTEARVEDQKLVVGRYSATNLGRQLTFACPVGEPVVDVARREVRVEMELDLDLARLLLGEQNVQVTPTLRGRVRVYGKAGF